MKVRVAAAVLAVLSPFVGSSSALADDLPAIVATSSNKVPACVTPGRLTAFLESRNANMAPRYSKIAVDYMRHGEELNVRWDYAFFQMLVETATLKYTGDVKPSQNNFAGLGATGRGARGESFDSVSSGVRAHLEHVLMYTGTHIDDPVADRTRKVQEWRVLDKWRRGISGPMTFTHLTSKWSPGDRGYPRDIAAIASLYFDNFCNMPDPKPEMIAEARAGRTADTQATTAVTLESKSVADPASKTNSAATPLENSDSGSSKSGAVDVAVLNARNAGDTGTATTKSQGSDSSATKSAQQANVSNCKVWTASYGGPKALIIRAKDKGVTNYTVLDVNVGREKREASAYIAAYAKGGSTVGEFPTPEKALKQAFEMCPEG